MSKARTRSRGGHDRARCARWRLMQGMWFQGAGSCRSAVQATAPERGLGRRLALCSRIAGVPEPSALADGLDKVEGTCRRGPWRSVAAADFATLAWVASFNHRPLLAEPIGNIPRAEADVLHHATQENLLLAARRNPNSVQRTRGGSWPSAKPPSPGSRRMAS